LFSYLDVIINPIPKQHGASQDFIATVSHHFTLLNPDISQFHQTNGNDVLE
jgi:hypothetical protein